MKVLSVTSKLLPDSLFFIQTAGALNTCLDVLKSQNVDTITLDECAFVARREQNEVMHSIDMLE